MWSPSTMSLSARLVPVPSGTGTSGPSATATAEKPNPGGTVKFPLSGVSSGNPPTLYPFENLTYLAQTPANYYYSRLLRAKTGPTISPDDQTQIEGDLVAKWEQVDPLNYVFTFKPNVKWQNVDPVNGRAFTAEDVKYTLEAFAASAEFNTAWLPIDKVEASDAMTVRVSLKQPVNYLQNALAEMRIVMLPKEVAAADGDFSKRAVGTGPFILEQYTANTSAKYKKNPDYYVNGKPYVDSVEYVAYKDAQGAREAYLTGQFPVGRGDGLGSPDQYKDDLSRKKDGVALKLQSRWQANVWFLGLKTDKPPFNNPQVAQAFSMAWDRKAFAKTILGDLEGNTLGNFTWVSYFDKQPDFGKLTEYNVAEAKKLLSGAGVSGTLEATVDYANYGQTLVDQIQFIAEQMKAAGINLKLQLSEVAAYGPKFSQGQFDNMALGFISTVPRYQPLVMKTFLESTSGRNALKINDPELDSNIKKLTEGTSTADQKAAYQAIWTKVHTRPYLIPLVEGPTMFFHDKKVRNWLPNQYSDPGGWGLQSMFEQVWLEA